MSQPLSTPAIKAQVPTNGAAAAISDSPEVVPMEDIPPEDEQPSSPEATAISTPPPRTANGSSTHSQASATAEPSSSQDCMTLSEADIYVIKRLSSRVNVLPVISRGDTMTNERLEEVKAIIRRDLKKGGVQAGSILGQLDGSDSDEDEEEEDSEEDEEDTRGPRTVVRIRSTRGTSNDKRHPLFSKRSRSRTRAALTDEDVDFELASIVFPKGVHSMRALFPFSIMSPDPVPIMRGGSGTNSSPTDGSPAPPSSYRRRSVFLDSGDHLKALRGKYTRNYRWGSVDVLSEFLEIHPLNSLNSSVM